MTTRSSPQRIILLICGVQPGGARKGEYVLVSDPRKIIEHLQTQLGDVDVFIYGQHIKLCVLEHQKGQEGRWSPKTVIDLESYFRLQYKDHEFLVDENNGMILNDQDDDEEDDDEEDENEDEIRQNPPDDLHKFEHCLEMGMLAEDLGITGHLVNEDHLIQQVEQFQPFVSLSDGTTIVADLQQLHKYGGSDADELIVAETWTSTE